MLTVMFNINSSYRRQEYEFLMSQFMFFMSQNYTRVPSFYEQIWQLTIRKNHELQIIADFIVII